MPNGKPTAVARSHAGHERRQSSFDIISEPDRRSISSRCRLLYAATYSASPTANRPTASTTTSMPSSSSGTPNAKRCCPVCSSMPTRPNSRPRNSIVRPRVVDCPRTAATVTKANTISAKYSAGPNFSAISTTTGASRVSSTVAIEPATNEPMAAVASAGPARPCFAIWLPSSPVAIDADSPGVLSRMVVVDPPYIAP